MLDQPDCLLWWHDCICGWVESSECLTASLQVLLSRWVDYYMDENTPVPSASQRLWVTPHIPPGSWLQVASELSSGSCPVHYFSQRSGRGEEMRSPQVCGWHRTGECSQCIQGQDWHSETRSRAERNEPVGSSWSWTQTNAKSCSWHRLTPCSYTDWELTGWGAALLNKGPEGPGGQQARQVSSVQTHQQHAGLYLLHFSLHSTH